MQWVSGMVHAVQHPYKDGWGGRGMDYVVSLSKTMWYL